MEDREHLEIEAQRKERLPKSTTAGDHSEKVICPEEKKPSGWSRRVWTGEQVDNLSESRFQAAEFAAQPSISVYCRDCRSSICSVTSITCLTVSGGGYIGAWLVGNVRRTRYWLSRMTNWDQSVEHLRRYSNYLAPHNGILSPDSWSMWLTWIRNAFLIQITGFVWLAFILMAVLDIKKILFEWARNGQTSSASAPHLVLLVCMLLILAILLFFLSKEDPPKNTFGETDLP